MKIAALLLAAGASTRFGGDKLRAYVDGKQIVLHALAPLLSNGMEGIVIVTTADRASLFPTGIDLVIGGNEDMSGSLRRGVAALPDDVDGVLVQLGDMPSVTADDIAVLTAAFRAAGGDRVIVPVHGRRGNPVILPKRLFPAISELEGDRGARALIRGEAVIEVPCSAGVLHDIDRPEDLQASSATQASSAS